MKRLLGFPCAMFTLGFAAPQNPQAAPPAGIELAKWRQYDLESRWMVCRETMRTKKATLQGWVTFLDRTDDFEALELLAVYEGYQSLFVKGKPGEVLYRRDAPQWMRVALWNINQRDGHNVTAATSPLESNPQRFLGWAKKYKAVRRLGGGPLAQRLDDKFEPVDPGNQLPPLDPITVILPFLDAPKNLAVLTPGQPFDKRKRYRHQVLRAIGAVNIAGQFKDPYRSKLVRLLRHPDALVRRRVMMEFTEFPAISIPHAELLEVAKDGGLPAEDRSLAMFAATYASHDAAVNLAMHGVLAQPRHPALAKLLSRVHGLGDGFTQYLLNELAKNPDADHVHLEVDKARRALAARLQPKNRKQKPPVFAPVALVHRLALAQFEQHALRKPLAEWTRDYLRERVGIAGKAGAKVRKTLEDLAAYPDRSKVPAELHKLVEIAVREILAK